MCRLKFCPISSNEKRWVNCSQQLRPSFALCAGACSSPQPFWPMGHDKQQDTSRLSQHLCHLSWVAEVTVVPGRQGPAARSRDRWFIADTLQNLGRMGGDGSAETPSSPQQHLQGAIMTPKLLQWVDLSLELCSLSKLALGSHPAAVSHLFSPPRIPLLKPPQPAVAPSVKRFTRLSPKCFGSSSISRF